MWDTLHALEALRACDYQIETLSNRLRTLPLPPEEEVGEAEVLLDEWKVMRQAVLCALSFQEAGRIAEITDFIPLLQNYLNTLEDRSEWPENWEEAE